MGTRKRRWNRLVFVWSLWELILRDTRGLRGVRNTRGWHGYTHGDGNFPDTDPTALRKLAAQYELAG